jgi:hypothetical protein
VFATVRFPWAVYNLTVQAIVDFWQDSARARGEMREFLIGRVQLAKQLTESDLGVHYADVALILCSVISACSSIRWPGRGIDRVRYVELLACHSPPEAHAQWVSIPALIARGLLDEADTPYKDNECRIFRDDEIDLELSDAQKQYPGLTIRDLKQASYASLIYEWLRCGYAHGYWHDENVTHAQASLDDARLSYIGRLRRDDTIQRITSIHLDYLLGLAEYHAEHLPDQPENPPQKWWLE